jgi:hypothetical protein
MKSRQRGPSDLLMTAWRSMEKLANAGRGSAVWNNVAVTEKLKAREEEMQQQELPHGHDISEDREPLWEETFPKAHIDFDAH